MKWILIFGFAILNILALNGQALSLNYNSVDIGRNVSLLYQFGGEKHQFYGGLKYHINRVIHDNQNNVFRKRFHASNFKERLGLQIGYNRVISINERNSLLFFYDNQFSILGTKGVNYTPIGYLEDQVLYTRWVLAYQEIKSMEQYIGIGFRAGLLKNIFLTMKLGGGVALFWDIPFEYAPNMYVASNKLDWEFGGLISVGLEYKFRNKE